MDYSICRTLGSEYFPTLGAIYMTSCPIPPTSKAVLDSIYSFLSLLKFARNIFSRLTGLSNTEDGTNYSCRLFIGLLNTMTFDNRFTTGDAASKRS